MYRMKFCQAKGYLWEKLYNTSELIQLINLCVCVLCNWEYRGRENRKNLKGFEPCLDTLRFYLPSLHLICNEVEWKITLKIQQTLNTISSNETIFENRLWICNIIWDIYRKLSVYSWSNMFIHKTMQPSKQIKTPF